MNFCRGTWLYLPDQCQYGVRLTLTIEEINRGELEILLPSYQSDPRPVYALYTEKDKLPLKVQVCINYLTEYFVDVAKIYQGMHGRGIAR